jgi:DNA helicase-2/ATP-dependent DNA helicase PcrA
VAVLDARNKRGVDMANALRRADVPYVELLNSTAATRSTAGVLGNALKYLARPADSRQLATVFHVWKRHDWDLEELQPIFEWIEKAIQTCTHLEEYLWPGPAQDWLAELETDEFVQQLEELANQRTSEPADESIETEKENHSQLIIHNSPLTILKQFRDLIRRWQAAAILPIDQLILLLVQDLFDKQADLALAHKFAVVLRRTATENPDYRLPQFVEELAEIARNQRRFLGFDEDALGFEPPAGKVTVSTMHRAKGLEWDRVYLMGVNNYSFPSREPQDSYFSEKWFVRDSLNLEAEILAQLEALTDERNYSEGFATEQARLELVRERLRLLFVGITRARQELVVTWNRGQQFQNKPDNQPAIPFVALQTWWEEPRSPG